MCKPMCKQLNRCLCFIMCAIIMYVFTGCDNSKTIRETVQIQGLEWRAVAEIQTIMTFDESGWTVPDGAVVYDEKEEVKSNKVVGHKTKYRTEEYQARVGYYLPTWRPRYETRTRRVAYQDPILEPIYATKYYYKLDRWVTCKNVELANGYDTNYDYPEYKCLENERVGEIKYTYLVNFHFNDRDVSYIVDKERWESLKVGQEIVVEKDQDYKIHILWDETEVK